MNTCKLVWIILVLFLMAGYVSADALTGPQSQYVLNKEDYAIYSVVLESVYGDAQAVIINSTLEMELDSDTQVLQFLKKEMSKLSREALEDFNKNNKESYRLSRLLEFKPGYLFANRQKLDEAFEEGRWEQFYKQYPNSGGYIVLSRVGYNKGSKEALVYYGHSCGPLCESSTYVRLLKENGVWVIKEEVWVAGS